MIGDLFKSSEEANLRALQKFRKILSRDPNPPIDEVIEANIVPRIVGFLRNTTNTTLQVRIRMKPIVDTTTNIVIWQATEM